MRISMGEGRFGMKEETVETIYWTTLLDHDQWNFYIGATDKGLCYIGSWNGSFNEMAAWAGKRYPGSTLVEDGNRLAPYADEIDEYLAGKRTSFSIPFDLRGTAFQQAVWKALCDIPYGEKRSYSDIAESIMRPSAVRAVGTAIGANPLLIIVPCHRVIGKKGALTGYRGGLDMKTRLLELEGQVIQGNPIHN